VSHDPLAAKLTALQTVGIGVLRPNSIMLPYPSDWLNQPPTYRDNFIQLLRHINASDNAVLLFKSDRPFPPRDAKPFNTTIDVYWIMHDGGILTMLPTILRNHRLWRKAELRIFCVAQVDDDREQMKKDLEQLLKKFRIDAQALVVEMGQMDISEFTYEKTMRIQDRQDLLTEIKTSSGEVHYKYIYIIYIIFHFIYI
jgi:potassium/chloride transporter 4/5/6